MNRPLTKGKRQMFASIFKIQQTRGLWGWGKQEANPGFHWGRAAAPAPLCERAARERGLRRPSVQSPRGAGRTIAPFVEASPRTQPFPLHRADRLRISGRTRPAGPELGQHPGAPRPPGGGAAPGTRQPRASVGTTKAPFFSLLLEMSHRSHGRGESQTDPRNCRGGRLQRRAAAEEGRGPRGGAWESAWAPGSQPGRLLWPHPRPLRLGWHTGKLGQAGGLVCC